MVCVLYYSFEAIAVDRNGDTPPLLRVFSDLLALVDVESCTEKGIQDGKT